MDKVTIALTYADGSTQTLPNALSPYAADVLVSAVTNDRATPKPKPGGTWEDNLQAVSQMARLVTHFEAGLDEQIGAADAAGGPYTDRKALGIAAGMQRSRLYRILGKVGRPTDRKAAGGA
ncbi:hypothetical protein [Streptomyces misionensis]|uniref:hypothetical protein n=1 Tax=Streptomyces misionensis TaxID=67331 RepID=UPI0036816A5D